MNYQIKLNAIKNKFELIVNGKVVRRGKQDYCEYHAKKMGLMTSVAKEEVVVEKSKFSVEERFDFIEKFVGMVARKVVPSLILTGSGGIGKSHSVTHALTKLGKKEESIGDMGGDFIVVKGYSTAKALYRTLYENNGMIIVFDDADSVFKDPIASNILKAALDSNEKRVISWGAETRESDDLPNRFEFCGQVIFISNLSQNKFPQALLSRSLRVDLTLSSDEIVDRIEHVLQQNRADSSDKNAVMEFIRNHAKAATDLNIRSALTVLKLRQQFGDDFARIAEYSFTA